VAEGEYVTDVAPDMTLPHAPLEYHLYVYGVVPPDGFAVRVSDCPASIVGVEGVDVMPPAAGGILTVSEKVPELAPSLESPG
jgi:hypothetical protein